MPPRVHLRSGTLIPDVIDGPMTTVHRKAWAKPELIVLVRSQPEERVLGTCKGAEGEPGTDTSDCSVPWAGDCANLGGS